MDSIFNFANFKSAVKKKMAELDADVQKPSKSGYHTFDTRFH